MVKRPDVLGVLHILQIQAPCFCVPHPLVSSTPLLMAPVTDSSPGRRPDFDSSNDQREDASSRISPRRQICPCPSLNHFPHHPPTYFPLSGCQPLNGSSASISAPRALTSYGERKSSFMQPILTLNRDTSLYRSIFRPLTQSCSVLSVWKMADCGRSSAN